MKKVLLTATLLSFTAMTPLVAAQQTPQPAAQPAASATTAPATPAHTEAHHGNHGHKKHQTKEEAVAACKKDIDDAQALAKDLQGKDKEKFEKHLAKANKALAALEGSSEKGFHHKSKKCHRAARALEGLAKSEKAAEMKAEAKKEKEEMHKDQAK